MQRALRYGVSSALLSITFLLSSSASIQGAQGNVVTLDNGGRNLACNFCASLNSDLFANCVEVPLGVERNFGAFARNLTRRWPEFQDGSYLHLLKSFMVWRHAGTPVDECTKINVDFVLDGKPQSLTTWGGVAKARIDTKDDSVMAADNECKMAPPSHFSEYWYNSPDPAGSGKTGSAKLSGFEICTCRDSLCNSADSVSNLNLFFLLGSLLLAAAWPTWF